MVTAMNMVLLKQQATEHACAGSIPHPTRFPPWMAYGASTADESGSQLRDERSSQQTSGRSDVMAIQGRKQPENHREIGCADGSISSTIR
jgi:hypothetical protein